MHLSDKEKVQESREAMQTFVDRFGPDDLYKQVFFDLLLEVIYGGNDLPILNEEKQTGNEIAMSGGERQMPSYEID